MSARGVMDWLSQSKEQRKAMWLGGLFALGCGMLGAAILGMPLFGRLPWNRPIVLLSMVISDLDSLITALGIPYLLSCLLVGMFAGVLVHVRLRRAARSRPRSRTDGWLSGAWVGSWMGLALVSLYLIAPYGIAPTSQRASEALDRLSSWQIPQYFSLLQFSFLVNLGFAVLGAVLGRIIFSAGTAPEPDRADLSQQPVSFTILGVLLLCFFAVYFSGGVLRALKRMPIAPSRFMASGDFGIITQRPCGPPCFQGIRPGVTTVQQAFLALVLKGAPCQAYTTGHSGSGQVEREGISCYSGGSKIQVEADYDRGFTEESKLLVDAITLSPPTPVAVGDLIARYGPPDTVLAWNGSGAQLSGMVLFYDELQASVTLPSQPGSDYTVRPGTPLESVSYQTTVAYERRQKELGSLQSWWGFGTYAVAGPVPDASAALLALGDFGILSRIPCGPPCFLRIRPGVTSFTRAASIMETAGVPCTAQDLVPTGRMLSCKSGSASMSMATSGLCRLDDISPLVGGIVFSPPTTITLGQFVERYGPPDAMWLLQGGPLLYYDGPPMVLVLPYQSQESLEFEGYDLNRDAVILSFLYLQSGEYPACMETAGTALQRWNGFRSYPYIRDAPP